MLKSAVKALVALTPYRVVRRSQNRFEAFDYSLALLKSLGFAPALIIDGGAHLGSFTRLAARTFPSAEFHLIEPQAACLPALGRLEGRIHIHPVALGAPEDVSSGLFLASAEALNTGAHIAGAGAPVAVATLDQLFPYPASGPVLLKLDLQGYELKALSGGERMLAGVEVILIEVSFFAQAYEPPIHVLTNYLAERNFDLFDIAALSGRSRDNRLKQGDFIFVRRGSPMAADTRWE